MIFWQVVQLGNTRLTLSGFEPEVTTYDSVTLITRPHWLAVKQAEK